MKNTLMIPLVFVGYLILCIFLLSVFTVPGSYNSLMTLASGNWVSFAARLLGMALYLFPLASMLAILFVLFFMMRHKTILWVALPVVAVLVLLVVIILVPVSYKCDRRFSQSSENINVKGGRNFRAVFPAGMIREASHTSRVVWFDVYGAGLRVGPVVLADTEFASEKQVLSVYPEAEYLPQTGQIVSGPDVLLSKGGGEDPLISDQLAAPRFLQSLVADVRSVLDSFRNAYASSLRLYYLVAGSFFLAVCCLWFLCYFASWKLLNALLVFTAFRLLFLAHLWTVSGFLYEIAHKLAPSLVRPEMTSSLLYAALSVVFLLVGIVVFVKRRFFTRKTGASYG